MENSKLQTGNSKHKLLKAVFARAKELGVSQEMLRETIAPAVIGKRLSKSTPQEIAKVLVYIHNRHGLQDSRDTEHRVPTYGNGKRYESSRAGLLEEIKDLAIARFGQDFVRPLNALCERFKVEGYRSLRVNQAKAVKATLVRLQRDDPRTPTPSIADVGLQNADLIPQNQQQDEQDRKSGQNGRG